MMPITPSTRISMISTQFARIQSIEKSTEQQPKKSSAFKDHGFEGFTSEQRRRLSDLELRDFITSRALKNTGTYRFF